MCVYYSLNDHSCKLDEMLEIITYCTDYNSEFSDNDWGISVEKSRESSELKFRIVGVKVKFTVKELLQFRNLKFLKTLVLYLQISLKYLQL